MTEQITEPAGYITKVARDWIVPQGADTVNQLRPFTLDDSVPPEREYQDFTEPGWSARAQIRGAVGGDVWVEFKSADTDGPRIELDADGWVRVILPAATTEDPEWNTRKKGVYDVELIDPDGYVTRLAKGRVTVSADVTRTVTP